MTIIWYMVPEIWSKTNIIFCHLRPFLPFYPPPPPLFLSFWAIPFPFNPLTAQKMKISKKWKKKMPADMIILHTCPKNNDHMLHCSWDMARGRCNCYFSFWAIFCHFTPLTAQKMKTKKMKNKPGDIIILHICTKNYD